MRAVLAVLLLLLSGSAGCVGFTLTGPSPLALAVVACLDKAWDVSHDREVAGGVIKVNGVLTCSEFTVGEATKVEFYMPSTWLASYHTHTRWGDLSLSDTKIVRGDVFGRPIYVRHPSGNVSSYKCWYPVMDRNVFGQQCRKARIR